ncbi:hypothetical protein CWB96_21585 [Pseudoalteromonas citrea]|uniref:Uncharacterized protein n=1 Tax=Pseudoalteromonas citrea TaxID=43655 RepID=A0A5S3XHC3_9GAMM|nr:hypothetical protein [Pseudoalteromonas citrea]TMP42372.1 hypothetical protein CWB97_12155 [Pseudoalteromonas citrea]TMP52832.1 hypothetical protein CWB96_21585 [Pseudoalteromonas citrea]
MLLRSLLTAAVLVSAMPSSAATSISRFYTLHMHVGCPAATSYFLQEFPSATNVTCTMNGGGMGPREFKVTGII